MTLKEKIQSDFKEAFKEKNEARLSTLKLLQAEIHNAEIAKRSKIAKTGESDLEEKSRLNDEEILQIISREIKKRRDAIEMYEKGNRRELAEKEKKELEILSAYLPEQMPEEKIRDLAKKAIEQTGAAGIKDFGKIMGVLSKETKGRADGALVSRIAKELMEQNKGSG